MKGGRDQAHPKTLPISPIIPFFLRSPNFFW